MPFSQAIQQRSDDATVSLVEESGKHRYLRCNSKAKGFVSSMDPTPGTENNEEPHTSSVNDGQDSQTLPKTEAAESGSAREDEGELDIAKLRKEVCSMCKGCFCFAQRRWVCNDGLWAGIGEGKREKGVFSESPGATANRQVLPERR